MLVLWFVSTINKNPGPNAWFAFHQSEPLFETANQRRVLVIIRAQEISV